ncbi:CLUMA_CG006135, isoform A [Clunio marinus]|uniref:CLUMA_CG006135, isoform A n=1 Tax=Clunio marinus TaxID=568069 RepID=A0A1J1HYD2_9DIPT|nr:CLUMA_CG006135, isoform A [Clunio marinus]
MEEGRCGDGNSFVDTFLISVPILNSVRDIKDKLQYIIINKSTVHLIDRSLNCFATNTKYKQNQKAEEAVKQHSTGTCWRRYEVRDKSRQNKKVQIDKQRVFQALDVA